MNLDDRDTLRHLRLDTSWLDHVRAFGRALAAPHRDSPTLLLVGTPTHEPWHLAAHLTAQADRHSLPHLAPTLIRHHPPPDAPPHLAVDLTHLAGAGRHHTVLVIAPDQPTTELLNRLHDARHAGATLLAIHTNTPDLDDLDDLAHDNLTTEPHTPHLPTASALDLTQHLVALATTNHHPHHTRHRYPQRPHKTAP